MPSPAPADMLATVLTPCCCSRCLMNAIHGSEQWRRSRCAFLRTGRCRLLLHAQGGGNQASEQGGRRRPDRGTGVMCKAGGRRWAGSQHQSGCGVHGCMQWMHAHACLTWHRRPFLSYPRAFAMICTHCKTGILHEMSCSCREHSGWHMRHHLSGSAARLPPFSEAARQH